MTQKRFEEAKKDLVQAVAINPGNAGAFYNLAALHALQNRTAEALRYLESALQLGFRDPALLQKDPDLASLRKHAEFQKLMEKYNVKPAP